MTDADCFRLLFGPYKTPGFNCGGDALIVVRGRRCQRRCLRMSAFHLEVRSVKEPCKK